VTLDPLTSLPVTMIHEEGGRVVTVAFVEYETVRNRAREGNPSIEWRCALQRSHAVRQDGHQSVNRSLSLRVREIVAGNRNAEDLKRVLTTDRVNLNAFCAEFESRRTRFRAKA
jgi:hypothetical protein